MFYFFKFNCILGHQASNSPALPGDLGGRERAHSQAASSQAGGSVRTLNSQDQSDGVSCKINILLH